MKKILVIEDSKPFRNQILKQLESKGFYTIAAENGFDGIKLAKEQLPDLVICDILMPDLDGYSVLIALRQNPDTAIIPFIFVTAKVTRSDLRKGMVLGADDYLTKPFTAEELIASVTTQLEKQVALQAAIATRLNKATQNQPEADLAPTVSIQSDNNVESILPNCPQLAEVFQFIEANYHRSINLCDVAEAVGYSPSYLTNLVRQQTGHSLYRWILERRMAEALSLLRKTDMAINQIATAIGYKDACHFSRHFRQVHGTSPQAWRNANRPGESPPRAKELTRRSQDYSLSTPLIC